jgi:hypothetical protein
MNEILIESKQDISYLDGDQIGIQKTVLKCEDASDQPWTGIVDNSKGFEVENEGNFFE